MLGPKTSYITLLEENYEAETAHDRSPLRPSAAGYCARKLAHEYHSYLKSEPKIDTIDSRTSRIFKLGHKIESAVIEEFETLKNFKVIYKQQVVDHGLLADGTSLLEGSMDWCLVNAEAKVIMDAKSRKDRPSSDGYTGWDEDGSRLMDLPSVRQIDIYGFWIEDIEKFIEESNDSSLIQNIIQLNVYATSKFCLDRGIDHASIIRYNKNDSRLLEIRFKPNRNVLNQVICKFNAVLNSTNPEQIPCSCKPGSQQAHWCDYNGVIVETGEFVDTVITAAQLSSLTSELTGMFNAWHSGRFEDGERKQKEQVIIEQLQQLKINEIILANGVTYRLKFLKSPKPHYELRLKVQKQR
jgi:hypothetical protein